MVSKLPIIKKLDLIWTDSALRYLGECHLQYNIMERCQQAEQVMQNLSVQMISDCYQHKAANYC